jgi:hypothetical protein
MYPIAVFGASEGMTCKAEDILLYSNGSPQVLCPERAVFGREDWQK